MEKKFCGKITKYFIPQKQGDVIVSKQERREFCHNK